jgi:hypothetical protein
VCKFVSTVCPSSVGWMSALPFNSLWNSIMKKQ